MWMGYREEAVYYRSLVLSEDSLSLQIGGASDISKGLKG